MSREARLALQETMIRVVVGVIKQHDKVLIAERPQGKPYAGFWEFPGGKIEQGERGEQALKRELHEELGIVVLSAQFCFTHQHTYPDKKVELEIWLITQYSGQPVGREKQTLHWVAFPEIDENKILEGNRAIMQRIHRILRECNE